MAAEDSADTTVRGRGLVIHYRDEQFAWQEWFVGLKDGEAGLTPDGLIQKMRGGSTFQHLESKAVVLALRDDGKLLDGSVEYGAGTHVVVLSMPRPFHTEQDQYVTVLGDDKFNATQPGAAQCMLKHRRPCEHTMPRLYLMSLSFAAMFRWYSAKN